MLVCSFELTIIELGCRKNISRVLSVERRHKNAGFGSISVTQRGCAGPISTVESHILDRCSYYSGYGFNLCWHENHNG